MSFTINKVIKKNLCLGCGICSYDPTIEGMKYNDRKGLFIPSIKKKWNYPTASQVCPAKGYDVINDSKNLFETKNYFIELGYYDRLYAAHSSSSVTLENASSGGIMTELLFYLLTNKIVDKVAVTKFIYTPGGPRTLTFLTNNISEIIASQGSKYCPVDISNVVQEIKKDNCKIAYIGTPCQIAGIRQIQKIDTDFKNRIVLTIANFCGGFKSFNEIKKISQRHSIVYDNITFLRYRGGGQPGGMIIKDKKGTHFEASYKKYGGFTGYTKHLRCHLCVDATGELADIACGDAWLEKYLNDVFPWSVILTRTAYASSLIESMQREKKIALEPLTEEEVCLSQNENLKSKKVRHFSRSKLYKAIGYSLPKFDGGYYRKSTSLKVELIIFFSHRLKEMLEKIGLYKIFRIIIKKEY